MGHTISDNRSALRVCPKIYAVLVCFYACFLMFVALAISPTHAVFARYVFVYGVIFLLFSVPIWRGRTAPMILAFVLSVLLALYFAKDPLYVRIGVPALFGIFSFISWAGRRSSV